MQSRRNTKRTHAMMTRSMAKEVHSQAVVSADLLEEKVLKPANDHYSKLPPVLQAYSIQFLDNNDVVKLSAVSSLFNRHSMCYHHWKQRLIKRGLNLDLLDKAAKTGTISNYRKLYVTLPSVFVNYLQKINTLWELLCLSGETTAVEYAIRHEKINATTMNRANENPLHLAACSGNVEAMNLIVAAIPELDPLVLTKDNWNVAHHAAISGNIEAIKRAAEFPGMDLTSLTLPHKNNIFHYAVLSRNPEAVLLLRKLSISLNLNLNPDRKNAFNDSPSSYVDQMHLQKSLTDALKSALTDPLTDTAVLKEEAQPDNSLNYLHRGLK